MLSQSGACNVQSLSCFFLLGPIRDLAKQKSKNTSSQMLTYPRAVATCCMVNVRVRSCRFTGAPAAHTCTHTQGSLQGINSLQRRKHCKKGNIWHSAVWEPRLLFYWHFSICRCWRANTHTHRHTHTLMAQPHTTCTALGFGLRPWLLWRWECDYQAMTSSSCAGAMIHTSSQHHGLPL